MKSAPLYGLVLAGGESRRMGRDKATLDRDGETQLAYLTQLLARHAERVFVSTRADQENEPERSRYAQIVDQVDAKGPVAGILSALREYPEADWLVVACDLPNVNDETLATLTTRASADAPFVAFVSEYDDLPEPLCAIYRKDSATIVQRFVDDGVYCPRKILLRSDTQLEKQPHPNALDNVNTPEDLQESVLREEA